MAAPIRVPSLNPLITTARHQLTNQGVNSALCANVACLQVFQRGMSYYQAATSPDSRLHRVSTLPPTSSLVSPTSLVSCPCSHTRRNSSVALLLSSLDNLQQLQQQQQHLGLFSVGSFFALSRRSISNDQRRNRPSAFPEKKANYYEDLQVSVDATKDEIHRGFLKLAKLHHPDTAKHKTDDNGKVHGEIDEFERIQIAYDVLADPDKRRQYDWQMRGIWRHNPSVVTHRPEKSQSDWAEFWRQQELGQELGQDAEVAKKEKGHDQRSRKFTERDLAELKASERALDLQYQQVMRQRFREIGRQREAERRAAYQAASLSYERKISFRNLDDDYEGPRRFEFLSQLVKSFRLYWRSFRRLRLVSI